MRKLTCLRRMQQTSFFAFLYVFLRKLCGSSAEVLRKLRVHFFCSMGGQTNQTSFIFTNICSFPRISLIAAYKAVTACKQFLLYCLVKFCVLRIYPHNRFCKKPAARKVAEAFAEVCGSSWFVSVFRNKEYCTTIIYIYIYYKPIRIVTL